MLSDRDALLAAIRANPEEDTPRLMFADWLDENGDATRAEFIRLQCELAQLADDGSDSQAIYEFLRDRDPDTRVAADWTHIDDGIHRRIALTTRADDLLKRNWDDWAPKFAKKHKVQWSSFRRGFPHHVRVDDLRKVKEIADRLRTCAPAMTLVCGNFNEGYVETLAEHGLLGCANGLDVQSEVVSGLQEIARWPEAAAIRELTLRYGTVDQRVGAIADAPEWAGLRSLEMSEAVLGADAATALFRAKHLRTLKRLHIFGSDFWNPEAVIALAASEFPQLTSLRIYRTGRGDDLAEALANNPHLTNLRTLDLAHNSITGAGLTALLTSPHLRNLAFLSVGYNPAGGLDGKRLAETEPGALRVLHCHGCQFATIDVRKLTRCPRLRSLWYLDLDDTGIGTPAVQEITRGFGKRCPPILWLTRNRIDDRGAAKLAKWKAASGLRLLYLQYNSGLTETGVRTLLDSPLLANLDGLGASTETEELSARMRARFKHLPNS
jgi:uncharacterized protein (TIGR02996 family)